jgi:cell division protein FtsB
MLKGSGPKVNLSRVWILLAAVAGILILGDLNRRMSDAQRLERDAITLGTEVASLEADQSRLQTQVAGATSEPQVEAWARTQARLVRDGERLVIPLPASGDLNPAPPTPTPVEPLPSRWDIWWALLFGS